METGSPKQPENGTYPRTPHRTPHHRRHRPKRYVCSVCDRAETFCWTCPCGFMICSDCMEENLWGMTCNAVVWTCPDCGANRGFGNQ